MARKKDSYGATTSGKPKFKKSKTKKKYDAKSGAERPNKQTSNDQLSSRVRAVTGKGNKKTPDNKLQKAKQAAHKKARTKKGK